LCDICTVDLTRRCKLLSFLSFIIIIIDHKQGKTLDTDGLSAEHLQFCHPVVALSVTIAKLFNLLISCSYGPDEFQVQLHNANTENERLL